MNDESGCYNRHPFVFMATIGGAYNNLVSLVQDFESTVSQTMRDNRKEFVEYVHEQLYSGINGAEKPLRPTYLTDPFFKTDEQARSYMKYKKKITAPIPSWLGIPARSEETPNLFIRGDFYDSITAVPISDGVRIETRGVSFGKDIERKYGSIIFGISSYGKEYFIKYILSPQLKKMAQKYGL